MRRFPYSQIGKNPLHIMIFSFVNLTKSSDLCTEKKKLMSHHLKNRRLRYEEDDDSGNDDGHDYLCQRNEL